MSAPKKVKKKAISKANTQLPTLHLHAAGVTGQLKTSQSGSNQNQPL